MVEALSLMKKSLWIEVTGPAGGNPLRFSASVKNLSGKVVTIEVERAWSGIKWEGLCGQEVNLYLETAPGEEPLEIGVTVSRVRFLADRLNRLAMVLELVRPTPEVQEALKDQMLHSPKDIKELWERWDQVKDNSPSIWAENKVYFVGLGVLAAGTALQFASLNSLRLFGYLLMFCGSLAIGSKSWRSLRQKRLTT